MLPRRMLDPDELGQSKVRWGESLGTNTTVSVDEWLIRSETDAFLVLHDGQVVAEQYFGNMTPRTRHSIWCGSKSFLSTILAAYLARGELNKGAKVTDYVPTLPEILITLGIYGMGALLVTGFYKMTLSLRGELKS